MTAAGRFCDDGWLAEDILWSLRLFLGNYRLSINEENGSNIDYVDGMECFLMPSVSSGWRSMKQEQGFGWVFSDVTAGSPAMWR